MHLDVQDLRNFYYRSTLGRAAQKSLRTQMLNIWPEAKGQTVVGYGLRPRYCAHILKMRDGLLRLCPDPKA